MNTTNTITKDQSALINNAVDVDDKRAIAKRNGKGLEYINAIIRGDRYNEKIVSDLIKRAERNKAKQTLNT